MAKIIDKIDCAAIRGAMKEAMAARGAARGRPLTKKEKLDNLIASIGECDSDCATHDGGQCSCGAVKFREKFGPGKYTP